MGEPVKIVILAMTADAAANIKAFCANSAENLKVLGNAGRQAGTGMASFREQVRSVSEPLHAMDAGLLLVGDKIPGLVEGLMGLQAGVMGVHAAMRTFEVSLVEIAPYVAVVAGAVAAGMFAWHEWNSAEEEAAKKAKDLADAWRELPGLIKQINDMQIVGILGAHSAGQYENYLTGRKKLYVNGQGQTTTQASEQVSYDRATDFAYGAPQTGIVSDTIQNREASQTEIQKWVQDQISAGGQVTKEQLDSLTKLKDEVQKSNDQALTGIDKQKAEIHDRYQKERDEIKETLELAKAQLGDVSFASNPQVAAAQKALTQSYLTESNEIAEAQRKAVFTDPDKLNQAYDLWKKYQDIFNTIAETEAKASKGQWEADVRHEQAVERELALKQEIGRAQNEAGLKNIQGNPFLTTQDKNQQSIPLYQRQLQMNAQRMADLSKTASTTGDDAAGLEAQKQIVELTQQQVELQQKLNAAQGASSWTYQLTEAATQLRQIPTLMQETGSLITGSLKTGMDSVATNLSKVIEGTESWHKAMLSIEETIVTGLLTAIIKYIEQLLIVISMDLIIDALTGGAGGILGFAEGGRPEVGKVAMVGERGPELFVPDSAGTIIPAHQTASILQGRGDAGGFSNTVEGHKVDVHFWDSRPDARAYLSSSAGEAHIVDIAKRNRVKIGVGT